MLDTVLPVFAIMVGCCSNVMSLEAIMKSDKGSGDVITFFQFVFVSLEGLYFHVERTPAASGKKSPATAAPNKKSPTDKRSPTDKKSPGGKTNGKKGSGHTGEGEKKIRLQSSSSSWFPYRIKPRKIPIPYYMVMVLIFFLVSVLNNKALGYNIALPFHMIFRSGSLVANMVMGALFFRKRYSFSQVSSVVLLSVGIFMATFASAVQMEKPKEAAKTEEGDFWMWIVGVSMLTTALLLSSVLGLYQEWTYSIFGKDNYRESMFYSHVLALPFFAIFYQDIITHIGIYNMSPPWTLPFINITAPVLWWYLLINVITQYVCIRGVFTLGGKTGSSLTNTLAISVRKFVSLIISVVYFGNPFSIIHWIGTILVFAGTIMYTFAPRDTIKPKKE